MRENTVEVPKTPSNTISKALVCKQVNVGLQDFGELTLKLIIKPHIK